MCCLYREERFDIIIEDTDLYTAFEAFLVTQFSQENLHFYHDVCKFHDLTDQEEITTAAQQLCTKYLGHGGNDLVLNLDTLVAQQILGGLQKPTSTMFDMAYHDVEQILKVWRPILRVLMPFPSQHGRGIVPTRVSLLRCGRACFDFALIAVSP